MNPFYLLPIFLGMAVVMQGNLNREIGLSWGLPTAVLINATVLFVASVAFYFFSRSQPESFPEFLRTKVTLSSFAAWYLIPGLCGFCLVFGLPWAFNALGSGRAFVLLIAAQIVSGLLWDVFVSKLSLSPMTWMGAALTFAGALVTVFSK